MSVGLRLASQLGPRFDAALQTRVPAAEVISIPAGAPQELAGDIRAMVALPIGRTGYAPPPRPAGWPFGLNWIQLVSVGMDLYPDWLFDGPVVSCVRGATSDALAEFALAAIFAAAKRMPDVWIADPAAWAPRQIGMVRGATLGIVGFGAIGMALAPRALALGMKVIATRRTDAPLAVEGVERAGSVAEIFERCDHVVLAAPGTPETHGMISAQVLGSAKPGLHLVNLARGSLIDDEALLAALDSGRVSLASLDVAVAEPLPAGHPFYGHPRVHLSPHVAVMTTDALGDLLAKIAANVDRVLSGAPPQDIVDPARGY